MKNTFAFGLIAAATLTAAANAGIVPLSTFGVNGWLAPSATAGTGFAVTLSDNQRDMAYNPATGNLIVPSLSGGNVVNVVNGLTGAVSASPLTLPGTLGGARALNGVGVGSDGAIYVSNLTTTSNTSAFRVYRWANESATPTVAYSGNAAGGTNNYRIGDNLAVYGSGANTKIAAGYGSGFSGFTVLDTADGSTFASHTYAPAGTATGDYRLGMGFVDSNTLIGSQNSGTFRVTNFSMAPDAATLAGTMTLATLGVGNTERGLDVAVVNGRVILATLQTGASAVRVYDLGTDINNPSLTPTLLGIATAQNIGTTFVANGNGTSAAAFGASNVGGNPNKVYLYTLNTNNGLSAYVVTIPEPTTLGTLAAMSVLGLRRRK